MDSEDKLLERALKTASTCLMSPLLVDFDRSPIGREDFQEFRLMLDDQLHLLLDILYQNRTLLIEQAHDNKLTQLRVDIVLLTCEQTESNPYFQTDQNILISSLKKLLDDNLSHFDSLVTQKLIETYKESLKKDSWKKQLGKVHGFPKFCQIMLQHRQEAVDSDLLLFMLSVGSNLVCHQDPHFKTIGLKIYRHIVELTNKDLLKETNIHQVIYSESFTMLRKSSELDYNDHLYEVLLNSVRIEDEEVVNSKWCKFDDVLTELLRQFGIESDAILSKLLMKKIVQFCGVSQRPFKSLAEDVSIDENKNHFEKLKAVTKTNYRSMRWITKLTQLMIQESAKLLSSSSAAIFFLNSFHEIFILTVFNIEPSSLGEQFSNITRKFILILMRVVNHFGDDQHVKAAVRMFLETISHHQRQDTCLASDIEALMSHELLK